jgi:acyl-coenzyme A thioesterase 13
MTLPPTAMEAGGMECVELGDGLAVCSLTVTESLANSYGTLHGGAISTIVDVLGTMALLSKDATRAGVSLEMNQSFCSAAKIGALQAQPAMVRG